MLKKLSLAMVLTMAWVVGNAAQMPRTQVSYEMTSDSAGPGVCFDELQALVQANGSPEALKAYKDCLKAHGIQDGPDTVDPLELQVSNERCDAINALEGADLNGLYDLDLINEFLTCGLSEMTIRVPRSRVADVGPAVAFFVRQLQLGGAVVNSACDSLTECSQKVENTCGSLASPFRSKAKSSALAACPSQKKNADSTCCTGTCSNPSTGPVTIWCITIVVNPSA